MKRTLSVVAAAFTLASCTVVPPSDISRSTSPPDVPFIVILGNAQDGGYPQAGCNREHCEPGWNDPERRRMVSSLGLVDPVSGQRWIFDATPDFPEQLRMLDELSSPHRGQLDGIFLTHAHIGHYTGLMHLGREVMGTHGLPVYAMPRMAGFLLNNGPWSQLVSLQNIELRPMETDRWIMLNDRLSVMPFLVPHRDEFSETVGYLIRGPAKTVAFIPDIDKWERWGRPIESVIEKAEVALLDATFYADGEIPRDIAEIPHPFISESIERFSSLSPAMRSRVWFIHMNHSNPALDPTSEARRVVESAGHRVAEQGDIIVLGQ